MKTLGRLAMAAALIVPLVAVGASSAGASSGTVKCSGNAGKIAISPGVLLSASKAQTLSVTGGALTGCKGFGIATAGTTGTLALSVQEPTHVTCQSIVGKTASGHGSITWAAASHNGTTTAKVSLKITGGTTATLAGTVTTSGSNYLRGEHISGTVTFTPNEQPQPTGVCTNNHRIKSLSFTGGDFKIS